jgi:hypothetical protein
MRMKYAIVAMMVYLGMFGVLTIISVLAVIRGVALMDIGIPASHLNVLVLALSVIGLFKSLWHIHRISPHN